MVGIYPFIRLYLALLLPRTLKMKAHIVSTIDALGVQLPIPGTCTKSNNKLKVATESHCI
ncbi:hypothetical protein BATDEDRAFT_85561 [Batrachochytrium dendrobatidis JAM81]|uniref:Uncharacterized protein n=1 Tax=Batrachochytrium dendrobatidis (strain JAM81 / FGSC 10211) TaxID=684364 RepID=F4NT35_BATDJ|nr:uncharacterized protein BATDEDRAFT_85561 [Batrachochytrium dendrobatidis JAM81]EGF83870.1 hypothetical protein BATDEDRAFT_85561 [Batrachochytrium dendrobatidis JAM81]|eukprot:XP_006676255.1 hypothetical protein BATDEDRAFT_85561 [Batrachochytrium dendrobatidis JAM81]